MKKVKLLPAGICRLQNKWQVIIDVDGYASE